MNESELGLTSDKDSLDGKEFLKRQIAKDLNTLLDSYNNKEIGLRLLAEKIDIGEKTLKRIKSASSCPHLNTLSKFYNYFFLTNEEEYNDQNYNRIKAIISKDSLNHYIVQENSLEVYLEKDNVFRELFILSRTGHITKDWIQKEYGRYGLEILTKMLTANLILEVDRGIYIQGSANIRKGPKALKAIISNLIENHLDTEKLELKDQNSAFYALEGVNEKTMLRVLELTDRYKKKIAEFMLNGAEKGTLRLFVTAAVDTINEESFGGELQ